MMDDREKAVEKVRKLMSLAENAGNENEAANAFSKARIFMKKYRLELSDIYSAEPSPPPPAPPRRKTPPRPLTPEEQHREMTRLQQQEEERLRAFQKVAEQQQQRKQQREREQQALRELEKRRVAVKK